LRLRANPGSFIRAEMFVMCEHTSSNANINANEYYLIWQRLFIIIIIVGKTACFEP
jgi:hypothetical protein